MMTIRSTRTFPRNPGKVAILGLVAAFCGLLVSAAAANPPQVNESTRALPIAYDVDVVVVGASTGAVAAALEAAEAGAEVFLAAPHPYLGEDMTATLRLWLEPGEKPESELAKRIFTDPDRARELPDVNRLSFKYQASQPFNRLHADTEPPSRLTDGQWGSAAQQSIQYDGDVVLKAELDAVEPVELIRLVAYRREPGGQLSPFKVGSVEIAVSRDGQHWKSLGEANRADMEPGLGGDGRVMFTKPVRDEARYVRVDVKRDSKTDRVLLGELEIVKSVPGDQQPEKKIDYPAPRPMHVKKTLDDVLLEADVKFLYSCYATDVLHDASGKPCGIVMANRAGRQAVVAKTIIDATPRGLVARLAGGKFRPYASGMHVFKRVVIGGEPIEGPQRSVRIIEPPFRGPFPNRAKTSSGEFQIIEYTLELPMKDSSWASFSAADQRARSMTYHPEQQFTSDRLFQVPPDPMHGQQSCEGPPQPVEDLSLDCFRPEGMPYLFVLGGAADVSRAQAAALMRPLALMALGARIGKAAAEEAASRDTPERMAVRGQSTDHPAAPGDVGEILEGVRPIHEPETIPQEARGLPVLGRYDVVVIGGGTGGAPAGIAAARQGAKTLVVEYLSGLGGVGTVGAISTYYWGNRVGFTATVPENQRWVIEQRMQWWRKSLLDEGADIWFGTLGCGAWVDGQKVTGAVVATPEGRGVVLADVVIDATGNSDVAAAAGAECMYTDESEFGMQGTGLPPRMLGATYTNTDFTITDETDMLDVWHLFVYAKEKYPRAFDQGRLIDTRERRRIVGDYTISLLDQINRRTYPDTVVRAYSNFDTHGYTIDPYLMLEHPQKKGIYVNIPYRAMLPAGLDGILVIGLGISAHRDAVPLIRMQPDIQNGGYAAGVAAAMAVAGDVPTRSIDIKALQQHLVETDNLPKSVLTDKDSYPMKPEEIAAAVESLVDDYQGASIVMAHPKQALPLLREALAKAPADKKLPYAKTLCMLGDPLGLPVVLEKVRNTTEWDEGWRYRGGGQFGHALSELDTLVIALGRSRHPDALPAIVEKVELLDAESEFSHHRAVGLALELIDDPAGAKPLAELLKKPGMTGYVHSTVEKAKELGVPGGTAAVQTRSDSLRELLLARALFRCGDYEGLGEKLLKDYTRDLRGHLARHAKAVLEAGK